MGQQIVKDHEAIASVTYKLPNKHYVPIDMGYIGVDNMTPCVPFLAIFLPFPSSSFLSSFFFSIIIGFDLIM